MDVVAAFRKNVPIKHHCDEQPTNLLLTTQNEGGARQVTARAVTVLGETSLVS
jgi:hypothetical protein